jgi:hypothetical protein
MGRIRLIMRLLPRGPAAAVVLNEEQVAAVGAKRFPVVATVNGHTWRTTVTRKHGEFLLGLNREVRAGAGVDAGDSVELEIGLDSDPGDVDVPDTLAAALDGDPLARAAFEALSYTHRKEYARWIKDTKREETGARSDHPVVIIEPPRGPGPTPGSPSTRLTAAAVRPYAPAISMASISTGLGSAWSSRGGTPGEHGSQRCRRYDEDHRSGHAKESDLDDVADRLEQCLPAPPGCLEVATSAVHGVRRDRGGSARVVLFWRAV